MMKELIEGPESEPSDESPIVGKALYKYDLESVSYLTLGGYDHNDFVGNLTWYDTSECIGGWNLTTDVITMGNTSILPYAGETTVVEFQTAYPYIGFPGTSWTQIKNLVNSTYNMAHESAFVCGGDTGFNQYCYWKGTTCD